MEKLDNVDSISLKWGEEGLSLGWTPIPVALFFLQQQMGLNSTEMNVLLNLIIHWWRVEDLVYPSQDAIAHRMGVSKRTVQRSMDRLEKLGLIERGSTSRNTKYKGRNLYQLEPLRKKLESLAPTLKLDMEYRKKRKEV